MSSIVRVVRQQDVELRSIVRVVIQQDVEARSIITIEDSRM